MKSGSLFSRAWDASDVFKSPAFGTGRAGALISRPTASFGLLGSSLLSSLTPLLWLRKSLPTMLPCALLSVTARERVGEGRGIVGWGSLGLSSVTPAHTWHELSAPLTPPWRTCPPAEQPGDKDGSGRLLPKEGLSLSTVGSIRSLYLSLSDVFWCFLFLFCWDFGLFSSLGQE